MGAVLDGPRRRTQATPPPRPQVGDRTFLVVVDDTREQRAALRFAVRRAQRTGARVALMQAVEPVEFQHWMTVGNLMRGEAVEKAEHTLARHAGFVQALHGHAPTLFLREGEALPELVKLITEDPSITILVLAAADDPDDPGPLVRALTGRHAWRLPVPVTIVPGGLSNTEIDAIT